jgi:DNA-binding winged helix-turn-helix (wHTH) protein
MLSRSARASAGSSTGGAPLALDARAFDLLLVLLGADGSLVGKDELLSRVWPNRIAEENTLQAQIAALRRALGADRDLIRTEWGRGYRFAGVVRVTATADICRQVTRQRRRSAGRSLPRSTSRRPHYGW